ncbi:MAG TPA: tail fiber protein [Marmoricola sp.]|jgi:microcystin-dependent protein|nr:tail fiber protein [Marmoricola sp.]
MTDETYDGIQGEIRAFPYSFVPKGWLPCDGQLLSIQANTSLFSIIGTVYGGDGRTTFALPDLRGRVPVGSGHGTGLSDRPPGQAGGSDAVKLTLHEMPSHRHDLSVSTHVGTERQPVGQYLARGSGIGFYAEAQSNVFASTVMLTQTGANAPHDNQMPCLYVRYGICVQGTWPG